MGLLAFLDLAVGVGFRHSLIGVWGEIAGLGIVDT